MVIYFHKAGRLANQLFAAAHLIASAEEHGYTLSLLSLNEYASSYQGTKNDLWLKRIAYVFCSALFKFLIKLNLKKSFLHHIVIAEIPEFAFGESTTYAWDGKRHYDLSSQDFLKTVRYKPFIILFGRFFRDYQLVHKYQDTIRKYFTPNSHISAKVNRMVNPLKLDCHILIGVHIRKGDYATFQGGKYDYSIEEYVRILNKLSKSFGDKSIVYLICSNEQITSDSIAKLTCKAILCKGSPEEDLYGLSLCDYIIGPPSTFSLWASFYGKIPLYHIKDISKDITRSDFSNPKPKEAYNFIFT